MGKIYVGTSGWQYSNWRGSFYPENLPQKDWLRYYSEYFDTVEVNSSFYRQTTAETFKKWQSEVGPRFVFSVKGNRFITHIKRLKDCEEPLKKFFEVASSLGKHVILWQLPPSLKQDIQRLEEFLRMLLHLGGGFRQAFEFRHHSWVDDRIWNILQKYNAAAVFQDWKEWPQIRVVTANFIYLRFHGQKVLYTSNYSDEELKVWAKSCKRWIKEGKDVYAYFNNDAAGHAVPNALTLKKLISH